MRLCEGRGLAHSPAESVGETGCRRKPFCPPASCTTQQRLLFPKTTFHDAAPQGAARHPSRSSSIHSPNPYMLIILLKCTFLNLPQHTMLSNMLLSSFKYIHTSLSHSRFEAGTCLLRYVRAGLSTGESRSRLKPPNTIIYK